MGEREKERGERDREREKGKTLNKQYMFRERVGGKRERQDIE